MLLPYLRHACASAQAIAPKVAHSVHSRFKSPARVVLLCGMVAMLGASAWVTVSEIVSRVNASSATQPTLEVTVPAAQRIEWADQVPAGIR